MSDDKIDQLDLSSWTLAFNGAEPVRGQTLQSFADKFGRCGFRSESFYPCYGMAETTLMVTGGRRAEAPLVQTFDNRQLGHGIASPVAADVPDQRELVGCGFVREHHEVIIVDPDTFQRLGPNQVGEIWVSGPSVGLGYLDKPDVNEQTFQAHLQDDSHHEFLRTGDLGFFHADQLFVNGRIKDLIILRGVNKYPQDIETTVEHANPNIRTGSAAAFTIEREGQEQLVVVAEVERIAKSDWDDVVRAVREHVALEHEITTDAVVLIRAGSIPKTSSGKIQRHACREGFLDNSLVDIARWERSAIATAPVGADATELRFHVGDPSDNVVAIHQSHVLDVVYNAVRSIAKERARELYPHTNIVALGLDSLERVDVIHHIESELNITFNDTELLQIETCGEVATLAMRKRAEVESRVGDGLDMQFRFEDHSRIPTTETNASRI